MDDRKIVQTSKFLSYVLRHHPESLGISLNDQGWANVDGLIEAARRKGRRIDRPLVERVVAENNKKRFSLSDDGKMIRAVQGHSTTTVRLDHTPLPPPELLYHGTATRFLDSIMSQGLIPNGRHHVHLTNDLSTALQVGRRHGRPVVLKIDGETMSKDGFEFYLSENGVWLTNNVPPMYLSVLEK